MTEILSLDNDVQEYFDNIKQKANKVDAQIIDDSLEEITRYIERANKLGQTALSRELKNITALFVYEKRLLNYGIEYYVNMKDIVKFIEQIKGHVIKFCELEYFPRVIPNNVAERIINIKENNIFDEYYILFTDYANDELLTKEEEKKRIVNKDPIIFGRFNIYPNRYYMIADWVDEYCDINFDTFIRELSKVDPNYKPEQITEDNDVYINRLVKSIEKERLDEKKSKTSKLKRLFK